MSKHHFLICQMDNQAILYGSFKHRRYSFIYLSRNFTTADFARVGRINVNPWRGSQYLALQRLTRHGLHVASSRTREKTYMLSNIFLNSVSSHFLTPKSNLFS